MYSPPHISHSLIPRREICFREMEEIIVLTSHKPKFALSWPSLSEIILTVVIWRPCEQANRGYRIQESRFKDISDASWENAESVAENIWGWNQ